MRYFIVFFEATELDSRYPGKVHVSQGVQFEEMPSRKELVNHLRETYKDKFNYSIRLFSFAEFSETDHNKFLEL